VLIDLMKLSTMSCKSSSWSSNPLAFLTISLKTERPLLITAKPINQVLESGLTVAKSTIAYIAPVSTRVQSCHGSGYVLPWHGVAPHFG
jgi:hypothetical protein